MSGVLQVRDLHKAYVDAGRRRPVLAGQGFTVDSGKVVALTGPSGSGKSTLLNLLAGTLEPDSGEISLRIDDAKASVKRDKVFRLRCFEHLSVRSR